MKQLTLAIALLLVSILSFARGGSGGAHVSAAHISEPSVHVSESVESSSSHVTTESEVHSLPTEDVHVMNEGSSGSTVYYYLVASRVHPGIVDTIKANSEDELEYKVNNLSYTIMPVAAKIFIVFVVFIILVLVFTSPRY